MEVKICGITKKTEIEYLNEIKVDYAGFVFFEKAREIFLWKKQQSF